ncbi:MAG: MFS transporter [Candidatus Rhabdochlamydia sp.]
MKKILFLFPVLFLDFLSYSAVIAFFPPFFLNPSWGFFSEGTSLSLRYTALGILSAIYPLAQVFGAPLLGHLSDQMGKKGVLILCYVGNIIGYSLCAYGVFARLIFPFFIGNFISGVTGVNLSVAHAVIATTSKSQIRARLFALSYLMMGMGYILGPKISQGITLFFNDFLEASFLLFIACALCSLVNTVIISFIWSSDQAALSQPKTSSFTFRYFASCPRRLKILLLCEAVLFLGWFLFLKTFQVFLIQVCGCSSTEIFQIYSYYGIWFTLSQIGFMGISSSYYESKPFFLLMIAVLSTALFLLSLLTSYHTVCLILPFLTLAYALLMPALTYRISKEGSDQELGKVMGLHQSAQSLAKMVGPLISGLLLSFWPLSTVVIPSFLILISGAAFIIFDQKKVVTTSS